MLFLVRQFICKPGFVEDDHLSSPTIAHRIERVATNGRIALNVDLLAAGRVYLLHMSPYDAVGSYPTHFTLTSPALTSCEATPLRGGFVSVALSLGLLPVAVNNCHYPILPGLSSWFLGKRPSSELPKGYYTLS